MSRKWIALVTALAAVAITALAASSVLGGSSQPRPDYATVDVRLDNATPAAARSVSRKARRPKVLYLTGEGKVDTSPPPTGAGPYIDFKLSAKGCTRVVDGGVGPDSTDVYQQGSYIAGRGEYHVLMGVDDAASASPFSFTFTSHLICLKGVR